MGMMRCFVSGVFGGGGRGLFEWEGLISMVVGNIRWSFEHLAHHILETRVFPGIILVTQATIIAGGH